MNRSDQKPGPFAVELRGVAKEYRNGPNVTSVLKSVSLQISQGECVFFVGPSGSGKTTLLSIIGCLLPPDGGVVEVLGHDVSQLEPAVSARLRLAHLGFVFQKFHLIRGLTVLDNCIVPLMLAGVPRRTGPTSRTRSAW